MTNLKTLIGPELSKVLQEVTHELSKDAVKDMAPTGPISPKSKSMQLEAEAIAAFEKISQEMSDATYALHDSLKELSLTHSDINFEKVMADLQRIDLKALTDNFADLLQQAVTVNGTSPRVLLQISDESIDALLKSAKHIFEQERYEDAKNAFALLSTLEPKIYSFWTGLGHSAFLLEQYDRAIVAYYMSASLAPTDPWPFIWAANACEKLKSLEASLPLLEEAKELSSKSEDKELLSLVPLINERIIQIKRK